MQNHDRRNHARPAPLSDTPDAIRADLDALVAERGDITTARPAGCVDIDTPSLDAARTLHLRRQLAQAAEHGAALLTSLGLPRLVGPDFMPLDPAAIGEAVEAAVAALDALDGGADIEDGGDNELSLGWEKTGSQLFLMDGAFSSDRELDTADHEHTALERHGRGFVRSGPDDSEDSDPAEQDDEHGSEDGEDFGHHASQQGPRPLRPVDRAAVAAMASRTATVRRTLHV